VDQAVYRGIHFLASLAVLDYNRRNPGDPVRVASVNQGNVEVKFLANDNLFPPGFHPAWALKDGYLLLASTPEAISRFRPAAAPAPVGDEAPVLRISPKELARALRQHHERVVEHLAVKEQTSRQAAAQNLDNALSVLDLIDRIEIARGAAPGLA